MDSYGGIMKIHVGMIALSCMSMMTIVGCGATTSSATQAPTSPPPATTSVTPPPSSPPPAAPTTPVATEEVTSAPAPTDDDATAGSSGEWNVLQCDNLQGSGTIGDPYQLGEIDAPLEVKSCPPLMSGAIQAYFSFSLPSAPGSGAHAGATFELSQTESPVYAYIETPEGQILQMPTLGPGSNNAYSLTQVPGGPWIGFFQYISDLSAGPYVLMEEKTTLLSQTTSPYTVWINPNYAGGQPSQP